MLYVEKVISKYQKNNVEVEEKCKTLSVKFKYNESICCCKSKFYNRSRNKFVHIKTHPKCITRIFACARAVRLPFPL